jgi:hypothetical protein
MKTNKINFGFIFLILSLVFIIPMNISSVSGALSSNKEVKSICGGTGAINIKDSFILSAVTLCLPGILEKVEEQRQYKCRQIVCTYESVTNGLDPAFCTKEYEYNMCKYIMGEIFAMPPMAILEYYRQAIAGLLENPVGILWGVATLTARTAVKGCTVGGKIIQSLCTTLDPPYYIPSGFLIITDTLALAQTIMAIFEEGFDYFNGAPDYCEQVPEIRKEMESILGIKSSKDN